MGCCVCLTSEIKSAEFLNEEKEINDERSSNSFNDLSLSSDSDMPPLKEWIEFKNSKSLTESTAVFSSFNCSCKKKNCGFKTLSNQGSIVDSFYVALPNSFLHK
ncbi:hypothetical protein SteCoe_24063 [Stentor coeruleus]|uniref:Uncharacterized protein n=1 Tax=Stentor coeruleus TaxID=5963 RepID=A0A1R2BIK0_9CILI|nr:hypothetical protein SteCoe_24063 [Stentor coeruleus]